ncbi:TPA: DUF2570 family protein [Pasteurella multocida]|uniref:DUF2570 family protein n=4 Tax=Pasteurella multocida TaxID=747 RepID=UPI000BBD2D99|nr:DUF2570 family protein [Pasteurella multocida]ATF73987.1 hypothetical protein CO688_00725 [Pasteurella multocida]ATN16388.1 DUF2570 domain-containing protein [Pasteurella multocida]MEB3465900.1 DUF2570 family protein [Pasteurella multocida]MEB3499564.1 DUF2570 family protein [Pasteurella multocida]HDR1030576.1 DUF2570 family protein [Pasteurella multocida]
MFSGLVRPILTPIILAVSVMLWMWIQWQVYSGLKAENATQAQTIVQQSAVISNLEKQAEINRQLTLEISRLESELRKHENDAINSISHDEKSTDAYNANAPRSIIKFLRQ